MIKYFFRKKSSLSITLAFICLTILFADYNYRWKGEQWKYAVNTDAYYYYRYLPSVFINHHIDSDAENPRSVKYFIGTSIFEFPFFTAAYFLSYLFHLPLDGYSILFPIFISIATLFYLLWGLYFFGNFLKFYSFPDWLISVVILALGFSTNIFHYTVIAPGWCHIIAFGLVCFILYHIKKLYINFNNKSLLLTIVATSFLFFVRPTDVLILLIAPFLAFDRINLKETINKITAEKKTIFIAIIISLIPMICQLAIYKVHTGHFFIWSYSKEGFNFLKPEIKNVLFSYSKGLFIYTPICFLSLFGLINIYKINRFQFFGFVIYLFINIYVISSWWCWNYSYSFGARAFVEHFPIFFFLLAYLLNVNKFVLKVSLILIMIFFGYLNIFQTFQAEKGILDKDFKTDSKGYWNVFLRNDKGYSGKYFRYPVDESIGNIISRTKYFYDMEQIEATITNEKSHSGNYSSKVNKSANFSKGLIKKLSEVPYNKNVLIRVSGWFYITSKASNSFFAISFTDKGKAINYNTFPLDIYMDNYGQWENKVFELYMPKFSSLQEKEIGNQIEFYQYNNSDVDCYVDDLKIEFIEFKKLDRLLDIDWER